MADELISQAFEMLRLDSADDPFFGLLGSFFGALGFGVVLSEGLVSFLPFFLGRLFIKMIFLVLMGLFFYLPGVFAFESDLTVVRGELGSGQVFVECVVLGVPRNCFLDTGSNLSFVVSDAFTSTFPRVGEVRKSGASGSVVVGDKISVSSFKVGSLELGPVELGRFKDVRHDLLGINLFKDGMLTIDVSSERLVFDRTIESLPFEFVSLSKGHLALPIVFGGRSDLSAIFDTGAGLNSVDSKFVTENPAFFKFKQDVDGGLDINGHKVVMKLYESPGFVIGGISFLPQDFLSFDFGTLRDYLGSNTPLILGFNGLQKHQWKFDLKNSRFAVEESVH